MRLELAAGATPPAMFPLRILLWWLLCVNMVVIAGWVHMAWTMFEPLLEMHRSLGAPAPSFTGFLMQTLISPAGPMVLGSGVAIGLVLYSLFQLRSPRPARIKRARRICFGVLGMNLAMLLVFSFV
jgi:hypothetical protein